METKLCRICGKLGENYVHIFKSEGLKNKIETCLPIIVSCHCLLPDTICAACLDNVDNFYSFIKSCLQNIIVLEAQYDIMESCLKTKRKHEKGCCADLRPATLEKGVQTEMAPPLNDEHQVQRAAQALANAARILGEAQVRAHTRPLLVSYRDTDSEDEEAVAPPIVSHPNYFDEPGNDIINEIAQRKGQKRKCDEIYPHRTKMQRMTAASGGGGRRRKSRQPRKCVTPIGGGERETPPLTFDNLEAIYGEQQKEQQQEQPMGGAQAQELTAEEGVYESAAEAVLPQICLLCEMQFSRGTDLAAHVFETHGIDMAQVISSVPVMEKRKKLPNLVKITDLKDGGSRVCEPEEDPPDLQPTIVCPLCPAILTNRTDLFIHLRIKHPTKAALLCGLCLHPATTYVNLIEHLELCRAHTPHKPLGTHTCRICYYADDNGKAMENHVAVHDFVLAFCRKQAKMYDPCDYIESTIEGTPPPPPTHPPAKYTCTECAQSSFANAREFSAHRRSQHQIFHCDLCNKFYGRNSHLWKHVNRLHKGHPSITCQLCYKTSASKYHLAQHFNKIHTAKPYRAKNEDFMAQKFQGFDFQSVKQSFMRQEMLERDAADSDRSKESVEDACAAVAVKREAVPPACASPPKEIDASSNLYTNIITNYTPPQNKGEYKCPKCFKGFHKKPLLKKHKKNCRPRLQKDLLTRCKTCSRIFKDRQSLTKHLVNYHSEYTCEICGQKVQSKCEIVSHIRFSHPGCHLVCHCGQILRSRADLTDHRQDHRNSFVCQFCADCLPTKIKLKMHILSLHRKILSLSCGICLKLFETQHILRDHVQLVHGDQLSPLTSCTVCGKNYGSKWKTYDHLNKSHGRIFRACKVCLDVFDSEEELRAHFDARHLESAHPKVATTAAAAATVSKSGKKEYGSEEEEEGDVEDEEEDGELSDAYSNKQEEDNDDVMDESDPNADDADGKVSLLEQRLLLGQRREDETADSCAHAHDHQQHPLQNSSKRTVYVNSNAPSVCEICMKTWPAKKHLWQHYIRCHKSVAATVCGICLQTNSSYKALQVHLQRTHPTLLHGQGFGSNFICRICGRYHNASSKLNLHMAIHENFDWPLLEEFAPPPHAQPPLVNNGALTEAASTTNGYAQEDEEEERGEEKIKEEVGINYESMIEQVECSSTNSDSNERRAADSSSSEDEDEEEDEGEESEEEEEEESDENSLESEMLQNMLREKYGMAGAADEGSAQAPPNHKAEAESESEDEETSDSDGSESSEEENNVDEDDEDDEDDDDEQKQSNYDEMESGFVGFPDQSWPEPNIFVRKPEELDTAIRSITYETETDVNRMVVEEGCDLQAHSLNPHEIQTAVDSIL